jgi:hypothetical protein
MHRIIILQDCVLTVCPHLDAYYHRVRFCYDSKTIRRGEIHSVEFLIEGEYDPSKVFRPDVQFEDGTVAVGLPNDLFQLANGPPIGVETNP